MEALEPLIEASTALTARPGSPRVEVLSLLLEHFVAHRYQGEETNFSLSADLGNSGIRIQLLD